MLRGISGMLIMEILLKLIVDSVQIKLFPLENHPFIFTINN
jgi:hypothetical protein